MFFLSVVMLVLAMILPVSADTASATLTTDEKSVWTGVLFGRQIRLTTAINYEDSARKVFFDYKYHNGTKWVTDKNAVALEPNRSISSPLSSSQLDQSISWRVQVNTYLCLYKNCHAFAEISN